MRSLDEMTEELLVNEGVAYFVAYLRGWTGRHFPFCLFLLWWLLI